MQRKRETSIVEYCLVVISFIVTCMDMYYDAARSFSIGHTLVRQSRSLMLYKEEQLEKPSGKIRLGYFYKREKHWKPEGAFIVSSVENSKTGI